VAHDRASQLRGCRARHDCERDLGPDAVDAEQQLEELALLRGRESVQLQGVLADDRVDLYCDVAAPEPLHRGCGVDEVADAVHVDDEALPRPPRHAAAQPGDHATTAFSNGGAMAWQIATARASAAWFGCGIASNPRIAFTILPT